MLVTGQNIVSVVLLHCVHHAKSLAAGVRLIMTLVSGTQEIDFVQYCGFKACS
jgi:hypothetical protein